MSLTCILEKTRKVIAFMQHSKWGVMLGKCFSKANKINCWLIVDLCMRLLTVAVKVGKSAFGFTIETGEYKWEYNYYVIKKDNIYNFYLCVPNIHLTTLRIE